MSSRTTGMPDHRAHSLTKAGQLSYPDADRLASLAALTMSRQSPGLVLPSLADIPTSYSYTKGGDSALKLARSLATLGLGSPEIWERDNGNLSHFIRDSLNAWLQTLGAAELRNAVTFDFAIVDQHDSDSVGEAPDGKLHILLDTPDRCGLLTIGNPIELLEEESKELGHAFYAVLIHTLYSWMRVFDVHDAEEFVERWRESIEMDMEPASDDSIKEQTVDEYCAAKDIHIPDVAAATPVCLRGKLPRHRDSQKRFIRLLQRHRNGPYSALIEPVLAMAAIQTTKQNSSAELSSMLDDYDGSPTPNWIVNFNDHDPIMQAFDEESQSYFEYNHAPIWLESFDPADVSDVRRVLSYVQRFVEVNRYTVQLQKAINKFDKTIEKGLSHGSTNRPEFDVELRAA